MRKAFIALFFTFILVGFVTPSLAQSTDTAAPPQVPRLIRFSGSVAGADAVTVGITFTLYKDQTSTGTPLWQ